MFQLMGSEQRKVGVWQTVSWTSGELPDNIRANVLS